MTLESVRGYHALIWDSLHGQIKLEFEKANEQFMSIADEVHESLWRLRVYSELTNQLLYSDPITSLVLTNLLSAD